MSVLHLANFVVHFGSLSGPKPVMRYHSPVDSLYMYGNTVQYVVMAFPRGPCFFVCYFCCVCCCGCCLFRTDIVVFIDFYLPLGVAMQRVRVVLAK